LPGIFIQQISAFLVAIFLCTLVTKTYVFLVAKNPVFLITKNPAVVITDYTGLTKKVMTI